MTIDNSIETRMSAPKKWWEPAIHTVGWILVFSMPFIFAGHNEEPPLSMDFFYRHVISCLSLMAAFYLNYCLLIPRLLFTKHTTRYLILNGLMILALLAASHLILQLLPRPPRPFWMTPAHEIIYTLQFVMFNFLVYMLVIGMSIALKMTKQLYRVESIRRELEQKNTEAELQNLKSQLNPHFLFNTLNNIYSLIDIDSAQAQKAVHGLSQLLRYVLYESSQPSVPLEKEVDFVNNYVDLMRLRLSEQVEVTTDNQVENPSVQISPLIFITLIENAFKHGVNNDEPSFIHISIYQKKKRVVCQIVNSYFPKDKERDKSGSGIGIPNLARRLELLYPSRHIFIYGKEDNTFKTLLELQV